MSITVYHGAVEIIEKPICKIGRDNLDFGKGFYLTDIKEQAIRWAKSVAFKRNAGPIINSYELDKDAILTTFRCKIFSDYNAEWLDFVVANRNGYAAYRDFDYVEGGVADDRVIDTINLYIGGLLDMSTALKRLSLFQPSNQICLLNQSLIDNFLLFNGYENIQ
jgi:hypothetical protein